MVRRKPISIADRLGRLSRLMTPNVPDTLGAVSLQSDLMKQIDAYSAEAAKQALAKYNAESFKPVVVQQPDATFVAPVGNIDKQPRRSKRYSINHSGTPVKSYTNKQREFVNDIYNSYYRNLIASGSSPDDAKRQARHLAQKSAYETGWGQSIYAKHNYGGHEVPDGKGGIRKLTFKSMDDYTKADIKLLDRKWKPWRTAKNEDEFVTAITTDYGQGRYNAVNSKYRNTYKGMSRRMDSYLNTRCGGRIERPKAWVGAVIGAASSLFGSILGSDAQRKQWEEQKRIQEHKDAVIRAENMTEALNLTQNAQKEYEDRFRLPYAKGGRRRLRDGVSITDGGYAIPIGQNTFLLRGGSHDDINETGQTGIGINIGGKEIEAEGGEVVQKTPKEIRVFSDTITLPNGLTPAEAVEYGANKNNVFKIQQSMNGDYGRRTMRNGGHLSRPVGRIKADIGLREILRRGYNTVRDSFIGDIWRLANQDVVNTNEHTATFIGKDGKTYTVNIPGVQGGAPNILPGRVGGFRPQNIERGVRATRNIANVVRQSVRRATPVNASKAVTRAPKTVNAPKGDVINSAKQQVKGYSWLRNEPMQQGYQGAIAGRGTMMGDPYAGQLNISLSAGDRIRSVVNNAPVVPLGIGLGAGVAGGVYSAIDNNDNGNKEYVYGQARGNNPAPYDAIQIGTSAPTLIGATAPKLNAPSVSTPSIDAAFYIPSKSSKSTTSNPATSSSNPVRGSSNRRRLRNRGNSSTNIATGPTVDMSILPRPGQYNFAGVTPQTVQNIDTTPKPDLSILPKRGNYNISGVNTPQTVGDGLTSTPNNNNQTTPFQRYTTADKIGLIADLAGSLGSMLINYNAAGRVAEPPAPVKLMPGKLITNYNIAPRLAQVNMLRNRGLRDTDELVSSSARLNARNRVNALANLQADQLWGEKTNREVELLNADTMNQQNVNNQNVQAYNTWQDRLAEIRNRRSLGQAQALQFGLSGLSDAVGNFLDQGRQNYADNQAMKYYAALLGDKGIEWFRRSGVNLRNGGRMRLRNR